MSHFVIYRISDSLIMINNRTNKQYYASLGRAQNALDRQINNGQITAGDEICIGGLISSLYDCAELEHYKENIEQTHTVMNIISGKEVQESVNTPYGCSVSSESYWCS